MAYKELMEKASDSLARLVAKAAKPIYSKTKPVRAKKSTKEISNDLSENYLYISSLSKVSNKGCPVREKAVTSNYEVPKKKQATVIQPEPVQKKKNKKKPQNLQSEVVRQTSLKSVRKVSTASKWDLEQTIKAVSDRCKHLVEGFSNMAEAVVADLKGIQVGKWFEAIQRMDVQSCRAWAKAHMLQLAGGTGVVVTLVIGTWLISDMSQTPVVGAVPTDKVVEKQVVANSFNSTQTIMLEDRVSGKLDLSDVTSMANVSAYSKPGFAGYAIGINGKEVGFFNQRAEAQAVLDKIKGRFSVAQNGHQIVKVFFKERVNLIQGFRPVGIIDGYSSPASAENYILKGSKEEQAYVVQEGETFWDIAVKNNISVDSLLAANPDIKPERLQIGDELSLLSPKPLVTVCVVEKSKMNEIIPYEIKYVEAKSLYKGDQSVKLNGKNGERIVVADVLMENGNVVARNVLSETVLSQPVTKIVSKGMKEKPRTAATGKFARPIGRGASFSSDFGWRWGRRHTGVDLSCHIGTSVFAADGGTVIYSGNYQAYGRCIIISHGNGLQTYYAHNSKLLVSVGDKVYKGQTIAKSGNTGRTTGPHLHFEVRKNGVPVNPENYLRLR